MGVNDKLCAVVALPQRTQPLVPTEYEAEWVQELAWTGKL